VTDRVAEAMALVDPAWIADRTLALVGIPSVTLQEAEACAWYEAELRALGLAVDRREVTPGRPNLYARLPGAGAGPALALNGHLDTIPIGAAWPPRREGDRICGRGATDMKGGMVALLAVVRALREAGVRLAGDLWITAVVGHEEPEAAKDGPRAMIDDLRSGRLEADRILIVEGDEDLWVMSMGSAVFTVTLESALGGTHTNFVPFGRNPIRFMGELIQRLHALQERLDAGPHHPLAGAERIDVGIAHAGDYQNRTPPRCVLRGSRRWMPGKTVRDVVAELEALVAPVAAEGDLTFRVEVEHEREPFETPADDRAVRAVAAAAAEVNGQAPPIVGRRIVGDANLYVHGTGVPAFYYGPGYATAHSDAEWVSVDRLVRAARVYIRAAALYGGVAA
jgi:acetylornithine deacetylase/succinyl-diaminopimelate desuccinylase-like protein